MRKTKVFLTIFLVLLIIMSFGYVNAHNINLDPNNLISFPFMITNGEGSISVSETETGYELFYQIVEISEDTYKEIEEIESSGTEITDQLAKELETLYTESNELKTVYDDAYAAYQEKVQEGAEETEIEAALKAYQLAEENYQNKVSEYNNAVENYNNTIQEISDSIKNLIPMYVEDNWTKTEDNSFSIDLTQFSGEKAFAVWAMLVTADGTVHYDEMTYTTSGTKIESVTVDSVTLNRTTLNMDVGDEYELVAEVLPLNATNKTVIWSSDNEDVAKVENGKVTAISEGTARIIVTTEEGEHTATCMVTVTEKINTPSNNNEDPTISDSDLPYTGNISFIIFIGILVVAVIGIVVYKKVKYMNFK